MTGSPQHRQSGGDERLCWLVLWLGEPAGFQDCAVVRADTKEQAATEGAEHLEANLNTGDSRIQIEKVQVWPLPEYGEWFAIEWRAAPTPVTSEFACCGGAPTPDGHSGYCPTKVERDAA